jgi:precorrin-3B synthase
MTVHALAAPSPRGACPGLSAPMQTGDGLLVRLLPIGTIPLAAFGALCRTARAHGNGVIEVTSRGSIQVRGLSAASAPSFAAAVAALGIAAEDGVPVHCNPLTGIDAEEFFDAAALADALRRRLMQQSMAARVSAKVSVAIDGGGSLNLATLPTDIRLCALATTDGVVLHVSVGGDESSAADLGIVAPADAIEAVMRLLEVLAKRGRTTRSRDVLASEGVTTFRSAIDGLISARPRESGDPELDSRFRGSERMMSSPIGVHRLRDGSRACGVGLAFGHADAASLENLVAAAAAAAAGAEGFRAAPGRALLAIGLKPQTTSAFNAGAEQQGFIVHAGDPRRHVVACAGAPICASAHIASRAMAPALAEHCAREFTDAKTIHVSGCAKGCAQARAAVLTIVGTPEGCAVIADGSARDAPFAIVPANELPAAITRYVREQKQERDHV